MYTQTGISDEYHNKCADSYYRSYYDSWLYYWRVEHHKIPRRWENVDVPPHNIMLTNPQGRVAFINGRSQ